MAFEKVLGGASADSVVIRHESVNPDVFPVVFFNRFSASRRGDERNSDSSPTDLVGTIKEQLLHLGYSGWKEAWNCHSALMHVYENDDKMDGECTLPQTCRV